VHVINVSGSFNSVVFATMQPTSIDNLRANLDAMAHPMVRATAERALQNVRTIAPDAIVFTDDNAPVERLTNAIMIDFLFGMSSTP